MTRYVSTKCQQQLTVGVETDRPTHPDAPLYCPSCEEFHAFDRRDDPWEETA